MKVYFIMYDKICNQQNKTKIFALLKKTDKIYFASLLYENETTSLHVGK